SRVGVVSRIPPRSVDIEELIPVEDESASDRESVERGVLRDERDLFGPGSTADRELEEKFHLRLEVVCCRFLETGGELLGERDLERMMKQRERLKDRCRLGPFGSELGRIGAVERLEPRVGLRAKDETPDASPSECLALR